MKRNIEDYLKFYIGCELTPIEDEGKGILTSENLYDAERWAHQPYLRRLSSITNTEAFEIYKMYFGKETALDFSTDNGSANYRPKQVRVLAEHAIRIFNGDDYETGDFMKVLSIVPYLLKQQFDLFGLIDEGLAIEKK